MIIFEHTIPGVFLALALTVALLAGGYSAWRCLPRTRGNASLVLLHVMTLAGLGWCVLLPGKKDAVIRLLKPRFLILLDTSHSMTLCPSAGISNRWLAAAQVLKQPWTQVVSSECDIEVLPFSSKPGEPIPLAEVGRLKPDGSATLLRDCLKQITDRSSGVNVAGALLLTDGTDTREVFDDWAAADRPFPIHTVRLEPTDLWQQEPDLRIDTITTSRRVTLNWKTEFKTRISGQGTRGAPVTVQLSIDGKPLQEMPTLIPDDGGERDLVFELEHPEVGIFSYRAFVPPLSGEANTNDNEYVVSVQVVDARNRLLYVEGPPRWEYKFLQRTLLAESQVTPVIFYTGPDGKPRGVGPVGSMTADMAPAQLALFNIVILGNLDAAELGEAHAESLVKFVEDGGSLVLLGGTKAWDANGFLKTGLRKILPVRGTQTKPLLAESPFPVQLTDTARAHPAFAGDPELWRTIPPVLSVFSGVSLSPGAQVLVSVQTPQGSEPIVATQRYGQGKVAVILTDSLWRWQLGPEATTSKPYQRFWTQLLSWLLPQEENLGRNTLDLFADRNQLFLGEKVDIRARFGGSEPPKTEKVECTLTLPDGRQVPYRMTPALVTTPSGKSFPGFSLPFTAEIPGLHKSVAQATIQGATVTSDPFSFYVKPYSPETMPRPINTHVLQAIADASHGRFFDSLDALNDGLSSLKLNAIEEQTSQFHTLWRLWPVLAALMALLTLSWASRKFRNMP